MGVDAVNWAGLFWAIGMNGSTGPTGTATSGDVIESRLWAMPTTGQPTQYLIASSGTPLLSSTGNAFDYPYIYNVVFDHQDPTTLDDYWYLLIKGQGFENNIRPQLIGQSVTFNTDAGPQSVVITADAFMGIYESTTGQVFQMGNDSDDGPQTIISIGNMMAVT